MEETNQNSPEPAASGQNNIGLAIVAYILFFYSASDRTEK